MVVKCECSSFSIISGYLYGCKFIDETIQWLNNRFIWLGLIVCYILGYYTAVFVKRIGESSLQICFWISLLPTIISNYVYYHLHYVQGIEMKGWLVHITDFSHALLGYSITMMLMILLKNIKESKILEYSDK